MALIRFMWRISRAVAVAATCGLFATQPALADPPSGTVRPLVAVGSETTQEFMNAIAASLNLSSYDASGPRSGVFATSPPPYPGFDPRCPMVRPKTSLQGVQALARSHAASDGCVHVARTSYQWSSEEIGTGSAYIAYYPFAEDAVSFVTRDDTALPNRLSKEALVAIYNCAAGPGVKPLLPTYGSGLRRHFLNYLGIEDTQDLFERKSCVREITAHTRGQLLTDPEYLMPVSVANYIAQASGAVADRRGRAVRLGAIAEVEPLVSTVPVTYVVRDDSPLPRDLSVADLRSLYNCSESLSVVTPLLPPYGSSLRREFLQQLGFVDAIDFVAQPEHTCVSEVSSAGFPIRDNRGNQLIRPTDLAPHSVDEYLAQAFGRASDVRGRSIPGSIDARAPFKINGAAPVRFRVYNAVIYSKRDDPMFAGLFSGRRSRVCSDESLIVKHGFNLMPDHIPTISLCGRL